MLRRRPSSLRMLCSVLLPPACHDSGICEGLHEAQHWAATLVVVDMRLLFAPRGAVRAGMEILSKLAGIFKPLQITLEVCCGKQSPALFFYARFIDESQYEGV